MLRVEYLDSLHLPKDRRGKWGVYISWRCGENWRSLQSDFKTQREALDAIPMMREMLRKQFEGDANA